MSVSAVTSAPASTADPTSSSSSSSDLTSALGLSQNQFMTLLTTQLQYQNPLDPVSSSDFLTQLAQLSSVADSQTTNTTLANMLQLQSITQGANLIGKQVNYGSGSQGTVSSIQIANNQVVLMIGGNSVPLSQVQGIN